jgi:hypothetical protein
MKKKTQYPVLHVADDLNPAWPRFLAVMQEGQLGSQAQVLVVAVASASALVGAMDLPLEHTTS